jgi:hypothetical protein
MIFILRQLIGQRANRKASKATQTGPCIGKNMLAEPIFWHLKWVFLFPVP